MQSQSDSYIFDIDSKWLEAGPGVTRKILGYNNSIMAVKVKFEQGSVGYLHKHPHSQVSYILSGKFEVQIGNDKKVLNSGDCYFVPPDIEHGCLALDAGELLDTFAPCREDFL